MDAVPDTLPPAMTRAEFFRWAEAQPHGRYERIDGRPVRMPAEQLGHARVKFAVADALDEAVRVAGLPCEVFVDGPTVEVDDLTDYVPDVVVDCGPVGANVSISVGQPVIVVEVLSPATKSTDRLRKLPGYFRVLSIRHCLLVQVEPRSVWHARRAGNGVETMPVASDRLQLDPPGLSVFVARFFARLSGGGD